MSQACTDDGATPLFAASGSGHSETVSALLAAGAAVNRAHTMNGATALLAACAFGHLYCRRIIRAHLKISFELRSHTSGLGSMAISRIR